MKLNLFGVVLSTLLLVACGVQPAVETDTPVPPTETPAEEATPTPPPPTATATQETKSTKPTQESATELPEVSPSIADDFPADEMTTTDSGLQYLIVEEGTGPLPETGDLVQVHYTALLADGMVFDSSRAANEPLAFPLGVGAIIPGWDEAMALLPVGSKAKLIIPPELAFGEQGAGNVIPPNATLYFEIEFLDILPGSPDNPTEVAKADYTTTDSGLKYYDLKIGDGDSPRPEQPVKVNYTGWLEDGAKFDSSLDRGHPITFILGVGQVIPGWDEGIASMKEGGQRQLVIPPELAYGEEGAPGAIPPKATLIFEVELLEIR
jgi:peptidylprolyl isomerase